MHISELDTPALVIDLDILERNLRRVGDYCKEHGLRLRPHTKTHKVPAVGRRQLDSGAVGLTVALDSISAARQLSEAAREAQVEVNVLAEVDAGLGRVGVSPGPELIELARG